MPWTFLYKEHFMSFPLAFSVLTDDILNGETSITCSDTDISRYYIFYSLNSNKYIYTFCMKLLLNNDA